MPGPTPDLAIESCYAGRVAGLDEAGRGPLAGPVIAAAVVFPSGVPGSLSRLIDDSKKLSRQAREAAYQALLASEWAEVAVGGASVSEIERHNILNASLLAMRRAASRLPFAPDFALVDGNRPPSLACPVRCVVGGDALCLSIAAASIVAKVVRDRIMARLHERFPQYGWSGNAGYATSLHRQALLHSGPTRHHRRSFGTVRSLLQAEAKAAECGTG